MYLKKDSEKTDVTELIAKRATNLLCSVLEKQKHYTIVKHQGKNFST